MNSDLPITRLQERKQGLLARFLEGNETRFVSRHAEILDDYFRESFARSTVGPRIRLEKNPYALVAVGGYGRREQCLHSDIDVLFLFGDEVPNQAAELVQEIIYPLWDCGLEVGYALRSLKECTSLAHGDLQVLTSLLDSRFLCGISSLYTGLLEAIRNRVLRRNQSAFVDRLVEESRGRHSRFKNSTHLLEPHLKESLGGLRDYHTMLWIARARYHLNEARELEYLGHLSHHEYEALVEALSFIWSVRNRLHYITGRKCDRLYLPYQTTLAAGLGFRNENGRKAVENFLGVLHGHMEFLKQQHLIFTSTVKPGRQKFHPRRASPTVPGLKVGRNTLGFKSPEAVVKNPLLLLQIFEQSAALGLPLSIEARRLVKEFVHLINAELRSHPAAVRSLRRILLTTEQTVDTLGEMLDTGVLVGFFPEMSGLLNRVQYDEYHLYPVDRHSLRTVQALKSLRKSGDSLYQRLFMELADCEPLLWAALFHDVGKGTPGPDHAGRGAEIAGRILERLDFSGSDVRTISFLVKEHLLLVQTATKRDLNDEKVVIECARKFQNIDELKMLYLLTVADSIATGPKAWNEWIDVLLQELFFKVHHILKRGELATPASAETVARKKQEVLRLVASTSREVLESLFDEMSPRYILDISSQEIARHVELYRRLGQAPFILEVQPYYGEKYRTVTLGARDRPGLFAKISGVLTLHNLHILSASIYTWRNQVALDIFKVTAPPDTLLEDEKWARLRADLHSALSGELDLDRALKERLRSCRPDRTGTRTRPDNIVVDNTSSNFFTIIEVYTHDFPGLLYRITRALFEFELDISVAKIATKVDQVVDVFYVRDFDGQKVDDPQRVAALKAAIGRVLAAGSSQA